MEQQEIFDIIKASMPCPQWVINAREYNKDLEALVNGKDFTDLLIRIEHKEDAAKIAARKKYARSIKDMFERLLRPIDNIYSATGGTKNYPKKYLDALKKISQIRDGKTLEKWLQNIWMRLYQTDPNGVIIYEWCDDKFYPTYKSINCIRNYKSEGQKLEWLLFEPTEKSGIKYWRFIDEYFDYTIKEEQGGYTVVEEETYVNVFEEVPGFVISDIIKIGSCERLSPLHPIIELSKEYLRDQSIKTIFKFLHGMPIFWRYAIQCKKCQGTGKIGESICHDCVDGYYVKKDITDCATLPYPDDKDAPNVAPNIAGFIAPDLTTWDQYSKELDLLYNIMFETIWGVQDPTMVKKTATEVYLDTQPMITKLNVFADASQWCENFMTNLALKFLYPTKSEDENAVILYGRNYIIEPLQVLLERYEASKAKGDNTAILDRLLREFILSKYKNDPQSMNEEMLRLKVEPLIHFTVEQVSSLYGPREAKEKMLFTSWWVNEADKTKDAKILIEDFSKYCDEEIEEPAVIPKTKTPE